MTTAATPRRRWPLPTAILIAMAFYLWADPATVLRTRQSEQAIKDDPNSGAGLAGATGSTDLVRVRQIDQGALSNLLRRHNLTSSGSVAFSVLIDAEGRVSDVRAMGAAPIGGCIAAVMEGQHIYRAIPGAATTRTVLGPIEITPPT